MTDFALGIYKALYPYTSREEEDDENIEESEHELSIFENEIFMLLEKAEDGWFKVKRIELSDDLRPIGIVPENYIEELNPISQAKALYDYEGRTQEEVSFTERSLLNIFSKEDSDWFLVQNEQGQYGFAPSNYLEEISSQKPSSPLTPVEQYAEVEEPKSDLNYASVPQIPLPPRPSEPPRIPLPVLSPSTREEVASRDSNAYNRSASPNDDTISTQSKPPNIPLPPPLPSNGLSRDNIKASASAGTYSRNDERDVYSDNKVDLTHKMSDAPPAKPKRPNQNVARFEVVEQISKNKKVPGVIEITTEFFSFTKEDGKPHKWPYSSLLTYSYENKHVFAEFTKPDYSFEFITCHTDESKDIVDHLATVAGSNKIMALKYAVDATEIPSVDYSPEPSPESNNRAQSSGFTISKKYGTVQHKFVAQSSDELSVPANTEVEILDDKSSKEWWKCALNGKSGLIPRSYIKVGKKQPSLHKHNSKNASSPTSSSNRSKPNPAKLRTWTDHSGMFRVDAQLIGVVDDKILLHKANGVKISVPLSKMSKEDAKYATQFFERQNRKESSSSRDKTSIPSESHTVDVEKHEFWFDYLLSAGINYQACQRYATAFERDSIDEECIPALTQDTLRSLGMKEGDIIRLLRHIRHSLGHESPPPGDLDRPLSAQQKPLEPINAKNFINSDEDHPVSTKSDILNDLKGLSLIDGTPMNEPIRPTQSASDNMRQTALNKSPEKSRPAATNRTGTLNFLEQLKQQAEQQSTNSAMQQPPARKSTGDNLPPIQPLNPFLTGVQTAMPTGFITYIDQQPVLAVPASQMPFVTPALTGQYMAPALTGQYTAPALTGQYAAPALTGQYATPALTGQMINRQQTGNLLATQTPMVNSSVTGMMPNYQPLYPYAPIQQQATSNPVTFLPPPMEPMNINPSMYNLNNNTFGPMNTMDVPSYTTYDQQMQQMQQMQQIPYEQQFQMNQMVQQPMMPQMMQQPIAQQPMPSGMQPLGMPSGMESQDASMFRPRRFGIEPQHTGRANLSNANPDNPFGF